MLHIFLIQRFSNLRASRFYKGGPVSFPGIAIEGELRYKENVDRHEPAPDGIAPVMFSSERRGEIALKSGGKVGRDQYINHPKSIRLIL